nr:retrovirus-related Pol polyprotein from transposon TNT 1-94 [Tanacetum cinerariifolium]
MSTQKDIYAASSKSPPPMLNKENYVPWSSRLLRYDKSRPNGKLIHKSILNGPYVRRMIPEPGDANREVTVTETFHVQTDDELSDKEIKQIEADDQEILLRVQQMMKGFNIEIQEKKAKLFNEWERFTSNERESIESYYHHFLKLMNDLKRNKHFPEKIASNLKFLNNLQPAWSRHVTIVHQTKDLYTADYTQLYDFLKYNQKEIVGYNDGNQFRQYSGQNAGNLARYNDVIGNQNQIGNGNLVAARAKGNAAGQNGNQIRCYNYRGVEEYDLMAAAADLDEIKEVNANCIFMANLQQSSTSGTQTDSAPVYDSDGSAEDTSVEQGRETVEQHHVNFKETRALYESLYQNLAIKVEKVNSVNRKLKKTNANLTAELARFKNQTREEIFPIINQVEARVQNFEIHFLNEAAKFVKDFKSLANEADASLAKNKALELEIKRLLKAVVSQDIMHIVQKESVVDKSDLQTEFEHTQNPLSQKLENENVELEFQVSDQRDITRDTSENTKFAKQPIVENLPKVGETNALSKPVTSNSVSTLQESKGVKNDKVISLGMFRINPFKTSREEKHVPNTVSASNRTKPITVSQPSVFTKKDVNSDLNGLSSTGVDNTKTRRPQSRRNTKHDRVPFASKSSQSKNKEAKVEEHHRNLLLSKNNKPISSACNNIKIDSQDVISKVVYAMCKKSLISVNHDECLRNYVNGKQSRGKKQKAKVSFKQNQMKYQPKVTKPKKVGTLERLATPKPRQSRLLLRWSPTGRLFDQKGNIIDSSESESQSDCSNGDNACTSNSLEPKIKRFPNSTSFLDRNDLVLGLPKFKYHKEHFCPSYYFDTVGISHQMSSVRTPQQNEVMERRNQTLVEAARTMLIFSRALLFLWAEAIATAFFTQNRSIIYRRFNKTPYELINGKKLDFSFLHVFDALCYPKNDREDIGKLGAKAPHQDQPSFNQKYMQQPMPNPKDIIDPTTTMNMSLALMGKAFELNYSTPTNNNQRISSNLRNRQIAQPGMNMGHDRQMQMVGGNVNLNGNGNLVAACAEGNAAGLNRNQIRCYNCRGVGTQTDKAPVYDSNGSAEVHNYENCYDDEILNMFTQEEQYTELLKPIPEPYQVPQNDNNVISEVTSVEQSGETVEQHPANDEETRALYDSLYHN